jgi:hypothetical protein
MRNSSYSLLHFSCSSANPQSIFITLFKKWHITVSGNPNMRVEATSSRFSAAVVGKARHAA